MIHFYNYTVESNFSFSEFIITITAVLVYWYNSYTICLTPQPESEIIKNHPKSKSIPNDPNLHTFSEQISKTNQNLMKRLDRESSAN